MLLSSRPVGETLGLTGCCSVHYPFTLPALCSALPSVNSLNEPSGIFFGQDPSLLPELGNAGWTPGIVQAMVKTSVYHRKALNNSTTFKACFCTPFESTSPASDLKTDGWSLLRKAGTGKTCSRASRNAILHLPPDFEKHQYLQLQFTPKGRIKPQYPQKNQAPVLLSSNSSMRSRALPSHFLSVQRWPKNKAWLGKGMKLSIAEQFKMVGRLKPACALHQWQKLWLSCHLPLVFQDLERLMPKRIFVAPWVITV